MTFYRLFFILFLTANIASGASKKDNLTQHVNPLVGTDFTGHTFPGATYPFGMVQLSPDTKLRGWDVCSGYHYACQEIYGFSHTHLSGTGCEDYCDILLMPATAYTDQIEHTHYKSPFSHQNEEAAPGYYKVFLDKWGIEVELTAGRRVGMHKYSYPVDTDPQVIIDLTHRNELLDAGIEIKNGNTITGFRRSRQWAQDQMIHFYLEFSEPLLDYRIEKTMTVAGERETKLLLTFKKKRKNVLTARIGLSSVSSENAKLNLESEVSDWNFDKLRKETDRAWNQYLGKIEITTTDPEEKRVFYTAMYHTAISPNVYSDVNGEYRGMDKKIHQAEGYDQYTVFSLWDTYRALHPLFSIIERNRTVDFLKSFQAIFEQGGKLPVWELAANETNTMIGYHVIPVIADSYHKGIRGFDVQKLFEAMLSSASREESGLGSYRRSGLVLGEIEHESVSKTLEYAYDDWCIATMAKSLGLEKVYREYIQRAQYYKNVFDPQTGFMRPKIWGKWLTPFLPTDVNTHFTEANSWQYSFYVPQDIETHIQMLGGEEAYNRKLDELFHTSSQTTGREQPDISGLIGQYAHGNEPSHHAAYLYAFSGEHWKCQKMVQKILKTLYTSKPDGLCGNDDCGQMSAWYVLSSLGFYPVTPGSKDYVIGIPLHEKAVIRPENGKTFTVTTSPRQNRDIPYYIQSATLNSAEYAKTYFTHDLFETGGHLDFVLNTEPAYNYGKNKENRPVSSIRDDQIVVNPYFEMENTVFYDSIGLSIKSVDPGYTIYYKVASGEDFLQDFSGDFDGFMVYSTPLVLKENAVVYAHCRDMTGKHSYNTVAKFYKKRVDFKITLLSKYSKQYNAGGDDGLIDGIRGTDNFRLGGWQGYQNTDFEAIIDMGAIKEITSLGAGFHQDVMAWIFMPRYLEFYISDDGDEFTYLGKVTHQVEENDTNPQSHDLRLTVDKQTGRYIRVFAKRFGALPTWHPGAGKQSMMFIDEVFVEESENQ